MFYRCTSLEIKSFTKFLIIKVCINLGLFLYIFQNAAFSLFDSVLTLLFGHVNVYFFSHALLWFGILRPFLRVISTFEVAWYMQCLAEVCFLGDKFYLTHYFDSLNLFVVWVTMESENICCLLFLGAATEEGPRHLKVTGTITVLVH